VGILIKTVRIAGFRGLENIEVTLEQTTILTGMNNTGKTSFLKALQLVLGNRQFLSQDDFFIRGNEATERVVIDLLIVPVSEDGLPCRDFSEDWEILFTVDRIKLDDTGTTFVPLRTIITFDAPTSSHKTRQYVLDDWPDFEKKGIFWHEADNGNEISFYFEQIPFFYMDAQRDILDDIKLKNSYLGKMLSEIVYPKEAIQEIEAQINSLNEKAVSSSDILMNIRTTLKELDSAMDTGSGGIDITPFTKKIRDLNKGLSIYYTDDQESFSMEYHGMGTRSWSSLLTLKSFINLRAVKSAGKKELFFPVLAIEEPEAHLHPNAQKKLYRQIDTISGQKIISTHSPYIAAAGALDRIRNFYKEAAITCGQIDLDTLEDEDVRKINRQVINTRGEIFFSRIIVFCEGETEEQALEIFTEKFFEKTPVELGVNFVGVNGYGNYLPFLRFAESLKIPWLIFSDAENTNEKRVKESVYSQFSRSGSLKSENDCIVFLDDGNDFEKQLIQEGYTDEIKQAVLSLDIYQNTHHRTAKEPQRRQDIYSLCESDLYALMKKSKATLAPAVAEQIIKQEKHLPFKVQSLFDKMASLLSRERGSV
jgi:putative ATP-dependent endonuclease of the OLD family